MTMDTAKHRAKGPFPQTGEEPDHSKFSYKKKDIEPSGAIRGCVCKACDNKREDLTNKEQEQNDERD